MGVMTWIKENFTRFPKGCQTGNESNWMLKDNCPCCIANPIEYLSNAKYHSEYPPKNKLRFGRISIYLCDFHLNKLMKIDQIEEKDPNTTLETHQQIITLQTNTQHQSV